MHVIRHFLAGLVWLLLLGYPLFVTAAPQAKPAKLFLSEHVLVGKIWDVARQRFINQAQLLSNIHEADYLLLGETHDNIDHHNHQAWIIEQLTQQTRSVSVAFEMIDNQQGELIADKPINTSAQLIELLNDKGKSWQYQRYYQGVFDSVIKAGFKIFSANMSRKQLMHTIMHGEEQLPAEVKQLIDKTSLNEQQLAALQQEIIRGHCNKIDNRMASSMVLAQRVRDAVMAQSLLQSTAAIKVLVSGAGHARNDRGVPAYLRAERKDSMVVAIGWFEVREGANSVEAYTERWDGQALPFDFVWFTPRAERRDPCANFKKMRSSS